MTKTRDLANLIADSKVGPSEIDTAGTYNMNALQVGGTTVINSSRNATLAKINTTKIGDGDAGVLFNSHGGGNLDAILPFDFGNDSLYNGHVDIGGASNKFKDLHLSGVADVGSVEVGGTTVIDSSRNGSFADLEFTGGLTHAWTNSGVISIGVAQRGGNIFNTGQNLLQVMGADAYIGGQAMAGGDLLLRGGFAVDNPGLSVYPGDVTIRGGVPHSGNDASGGKIYLQTGGTSANRLTIRGDGNIGVGMAGSSSAKFTIQGKAGTVGNSITDKTLHVIEGGYNDGPTFQVSDSSGVSRFHVNGDGATVVNAVQSANGDFQVQSDSNTHALFVDAGNDAVCINTNSITTAPLNIQCDTNARAIRIVGRSDDYGEIDFFENDDTTQLVRHQAHNTYYQIRTYAIPLKLATNQVDRFIIDVNGRKIMNGASTWSGITGGTQSGSAFNIAGDFYSSRATSSNSIHVRWYNTNGNVGNIATNGSGTVYSTTSDRRLKDNIEPIANGTEKLMAMNPVTHTWIADPEADTVHGFIAQEMQEIVPEAVSGDPDGEEMMSMDYGRITPVLVAALQDAHKKIEALEERLAELEIK